MIPASPCDPSPNPAPLRSPNADGEDFASGQESHRRAMPLQRLVGGGMRFDDAQAIHLMSTDGIAWEDAGIWLGDRNMRLALAASSRLSAKAFFRYAAACYRVGQVALPTDTNRKRVDHARMVAAFARACELDHPSTEKHEIPWREGKLCGWLMRPEAVDAPPVVIVIGGFDGWREEYWPGVVELVARGMAVFLADGPGQGETRLVHRLYLDLDFHLALSAMADYLRSDPRLGSTIGIWGNSLGGFLAARSAAFDPRFTALCVNGGSMRPIELPERFPRFWQKVEAMSGTGRQRAIELMESFELDDHIHNITAPLLQLHGEPDQVFQLHNARQIHDRSASTNKTLYVWPDGDHCIYNHSEEKYLIISDWFASHLVSGPSGLSPA